MGWTLLLIGILINMTGVISIRFGQELKKNLIATLGYGLYIAGFVFISLSFKYLDIGLAYAFWSGLGSLLALCCGVLFFKETLSPRKLIFFSLLVIGVTGMSLSA